MDKKNSDSLRTERLINDAAKKYVTETKMNQPSMINSELTVASDSTEIVILRDEERRILAHYQYLKDNQFLRLDSKE